MAIQLRVGYTPYQKHRKRGDSTWYVRVHEKGQKVFDVCLHTDKREQAVAFCQLRKSEVELYNAKVLAGEPAEGDLQKLLRYGTRLIAQKGPSEAVLVRTAADAWETYLRRSGKRPATISTYMRALWNCVDPAMPVTALNRDNLNKSLQKHDALKSATRKSYSVVLREFVKFLVREYGIDRNLIDCFTFVKVIQEEKGYWTMEQVRKMIGCIECHDELITRTYKAWAWFMAVTGARQGESAVIEWTDLKDSTVVLRAENTKNNQTRTVPVPVGVYDMLLALPRTNRYVFPYLATKTQATRFAVIRRAAEKAGIPKGGLHTLRHSASMYLYSKISDIKLCSQILGHSPNTALQYYQKTREVEKTRVAVEQAYSEEDQLPTLLDDMIDEGLI